MIIKAWTQHRLGMRFLWRYAAYIAMVLTGMNIANASETTSPAETLVNSPRPLVIGHRGYSAFAPENTLASFQLALTAGADLVELDYHHSKDGVPMVIHDGTLDRTTDAVARWGGSKIQVASKTAAQLRELDAGSWFKPRIGGARLPLLTEALDLIQSNGVTLIERKGGDAATLVRLLRERNLVNRLVVQSFQWDYLKDFHQQEPRQILGALGPPSVWGTKTLTDQEKVLSPRWIDEVQSIGARIAVWNKAVTPEAIGYAHQRRLKVWVYTINDPKVATVLLAQGVDGIITDNPSIIWRAMALRGAK